MARALCLLLLLCIVTFARAASDSREHLPSFMHHMYFGAEAGYSYVDYQKSTFRPGLEPVDISERWGLAAHPYLG